MYGFNIQLADNFDSVVVRTTEALKTEGFGVLTDIDVKKTMQEKLGVAGCLIAYWVRATRRWHIER